MWHLATRSKRNAERLFRIYSDLAECLTRLDFDRFSQHPAFWLVFFQIFFA
jgi:hypothetical protein